MGCLNGFGKAYTEIGNCIGIPMNFSSPVTTGIPYDTFILSLSYGRMP
jgi:hypothetical protein